jgi:hypothetical protein
VEDFTAGADDETALVCGGGAILLVTVPRTPPTTEAVFIQCSDA